MKSLRLLTGATIAALTTTAALTIALAPGCSGEDPAIENPGTGGVGGAGGAVGECSPGESRCEPDGTASTCDPGGHWASIAACPLGCQDGACVGMVKMALGDSHSCALLSDGSIRCWGSGEYGQLGDGTSGPGAAKTTPTQVQGLAGATDVSARGSHSCAALSDGTARCWGDNAYGALGNGVIELSAIPQDVLGAAGVSGVALGVVHSCAWLEDGGAKCWGNNGSGQLGNGSTTAALTPATVSGLADALALGAGDRHTCALRQGGAVSCWGGGDGGQLGDGTSGAGAQQLTPSPVPGLSGAVQVAVGHYAVCALMGDGGVQCWGTTSTGRSASGTTRTGRRPPRCRRWRRSRRSRRGGGMRARCARTVRCSAGAEAGTGRSGTAMSPTSGRRRRWPTCRRSRGSPPAPVIPAPGRRWVRRSAGAAMTSGSSATGPWAGTGTCRER
ncbi:MAG: hypothetical protein IT372_37240 [Polyangiaceae bacterium]|nr:hypothetical protein [Polyangiaceae bacterium]